ncbi:hypothetical protein BVC80_9073g46 [Macleaya cordata]|uniref:Uncharacterized protein n=1 Tax=Macleaya cordata TaxID=56857 RepID=A0A200PTU9_MACCD|nr:hypothetical protein BVC80_9073g46 [Macleaya cordata]
MGECGTSDIKITQTVVKEVKGVFEYEVEILNHCESCAVSNLVINCKEFQTIEPVDPLLCKELGDSICLINGGDIITPGIPFRFRYAWERPASFTPRKLFTKCSP